MQAFIYASHQQGLQSIAEVPEFIAGFLYGMTGANHLTELQTCIEGTSELLPYIEGWIHDMENFDFVSAWDNYDAFL